MKVTAISGYGVKGPACFLVEAQDRRILLDLGEGPDPGVRPDLSQVGAVDAIILSHSHADHTGALDLASGLGRPPIWCTPVVADLIDAERFGPINHLPYAGASSILGIDVLVGQTGHAPGAIWTRLGGPGGLLYTGDVCSESPLFPSNPMPPAAGLVIDASYGTYDDPLENAIAAIHARAADGPLLLPAPAGGRGLEMALVLHGRGHNVSLCPSHVKAGKLLDPSWLRFNAAEAFGFVLHVAGRLTAKSAPSGVMIAASADGDGGLARTLLDRWADDLAVQFIFTGHLAAATRGRQLVDTGRASFIRWNVHPRLSHLRKMVEQTRAGQILPAFLAADRLPSLAAELKLGSRLAGPCFEIPSV